MKIKWYYNPGSKNQAPLYSFDDYVISCWNEGGDACYCLRYRPPGQHIVIGDFKTLEESKNAAELHFKNLDKILVIV